MIWQAWMLIAGFLLLWLGGSWWATSRSAPTATSLGRFAVLAAAYGAIFAGLGFWWRAPIDARHALDAAFASWSAAPPAMSCEQFEAALPAVRRAAEDLVTISNEGEMKVAGAVWAGISEEQKAALTALAATARKCVGPAGASGPVLIRDLDTGAALTPAG